LSNRPWGRGTPKVPSRPAPTAAQAAGAGRQVTLTQAEVHQARELLESVMTIAAHGILYRWGQSLGARILSDANKAGGSLTDAVGHILVQRGWAKEVRFFTAKVQVLGSLEAKQGVEPCCHIMRGMIHVVVAGGDGGVMVREEKCSGQGASECTFSITRGGHPA
jgi:predicted hydrocarbon binding protein